MNEIILSIHNLNTVFHTQKGDVHAIRDLNLEVERGKILALVGESGSGKSTLGFSIMRLIESPGEIVSGSMIFNGSEDSVSIMDLSLPKLRAFRWKKIAMIFQSAMNVLNPVARIEDQFYDTFEAHNIKGDLSERIDKYLSIAGLGPKVRRLYPHELSGGMKQRVSIALALSCEPELLIADEPTTALDVIVQSEILASLSKIKEELNLTVIFITHDLSVAASIADKVGIFYAGRIVELGMKEDVLAHPLHPYTDLLLSSMITLSTDKEGYLRVSEGFPPDLSKPISGCSFYNRCSIAENNCLSYDLNPVIVGKSHIVECIKPGQASKEDGNEI